MATPDIICLGEALVEFNEREPGVFQQGFGGDTSNCAIAAARQGAAVGYLSAVGEDAFGERLLALWHEEGVDATHVVRDRRHATGHYFVTHDEKGHAFTYHRAGSAASHMTPAMLPREYLAGAKLLQISAISQAIGHEARGTVDAAMAIAREAGVRIAYDTNLRLKLWSLHRAQEVIHASLTGCDIALPGLDDARRLTGLAQPEAIVDLYRSLGPELVVLTLGGDGVLVADGERRERIPGHEVQCVDATAAGDTFDGAFLAMLCAGADPVQAARHANAAAALATTGYGAVAPMPTRKQVDDFLANQKNQKGTESF
jgi:2-dehydro-3-deoxygluconokinase